MPLPAPVRLSITSCWPSVSLMAAPTSRAVMSAAEPGGKPMISRSGCDGKSPARPCATAAAALSTRLRPKITIRRMAVLPVLGAFYLGGPPQYNSPQFRWLERSGKTILSPSGCDVAHRPKAGALPLFLQCSMKDILTLCLGALLFGFGVHRRRSVLGLPRMRSELMQEGENSPQ